MNPHGRVLLVTPYDERGMYGEFLRHHRVQVDDFERPEDALALLDAGASPDVVVVDFVFIGGDMDGPSVVRAIRQRVDEATSIIVVSGFGRREDGERARAAGADRFLIKPILPRDMLYEVRQALVRRLENRRIDWSWTFARPPLIPPVERRGSIAAASMEQASDDSMLS
jgi:two-component system, sensor histidine kinase